MDAVIEWARWYVRAGLSVIPIRADGSKAPALGKGEVEQYRERFPEDAEFQKWFAPERAVGLAVVCGKVSGNLAVIDIESQVAWERWTGRLRDAGALWLIDRCPVVRTPKGGRHVYCRLSDGWVAGGKLAMLSKSETLVEVRGQGHYVLAPGCPPACHELNRSYEFEARGWLGGD